MLKMIHIVYLIFNPIEKHRAEINKMKENMKAIDE
jgi:hypothetical protein